LAGSENVFEYSAGVAWHDMHAQMKMKRIGLFGGSFNPVHLGHLLIAQAAFEEMELAHIFFVPAAQSPFKPTAELAPARERLLLLRLALAGQSHCTVDDQEIIRGGVSYSIDTVRNYAARFPSSQLVYIIGGDHVRLLPKWRAAEELSALVEFAVVPRPGEQLDMLRPPFRGQALRGWPLDLSASQIRERVRAGLPVDMLVPGAVAEAIRNNQLYL
jgi:nicotinate-nucleotide adenylyltransferase